MTTILNVIYKFNTVINIIINFSLAEGIKTVINIFVFTLNYNTPRLSGSK